MIEFFKKHKTKIIIALVIVSMLTVAFLLGENPSNTNNNVFESSIVSDTSTPLEISEVVSEKSNIKTENNNSSEAEISKLDSSSSSETKLSDNSIISESSEVSEISETESIVESSISKIITESSVLDESSDNTSSDISEIIEGSSNSEIVQESPQLTCTISISCSKILENMDKLDKSKKSLIPPDGYILKETRVTYSEGETVFDVLKRVCTENRIHLEFSESPLYGSVYIEGINNIYECDCGSMSGWMYCVNGNFYNYGCSGYQLSQNDRVELLYTCNLGKDLEVGTF